jgi:ketosteroid isomerase-like protein
VSIRSADGNSGKANMTDTDHILRNKELAQAFIDALATDGLEAIADLFASDAVLWSLTDRTSLSFAEYVEVYHRLITTRFVDGIQMTTNLVMAEEDRVVVECESHGDMRNGRHYNNMYLYLFRIDDEGIRNIWEYNDTHHSQTVLRAT